MMRIGVAFGPTLSYEDVLHGTTIAEELGLDSVWVTEGWGADSLVTVASLGAVTEKVKLAPGVLNVFSRSPAAIAMGVATLDKLSKGRVIFGLGVSSPPLIEDWHGLKYLRYMRRLREYVVISRQILSGVPVEYQGELFKLRRFKLAFSPFRGSIPTYVAALGDGMLRLAGELGDGVLLFLYPKEHIEGALRIVDEGAKKAGKSLNEIDVACIVTCYASSDSNEARKRARRFVAHYVCAMGPYYSKLLSSHGYEREVTSIREAWGQGRRDEAVGSVTDSMVDSVCVAGTPDECAARLREYSKVGVKLPIIGFPVAEPDMKKWLDSMRNIIPLL